MANYRMTIQYDGTRYSGWQSQHATDATIQGKLETVLTRMTGQQVDVIGSGRTDAGVHAIGQVANFHLKQPRNTGELLDGLNRYLPEDIAVSSLTEVDERFHSRFLFAAFLFILCFRRYSNAGHYIKGMCMITGFRLMWKGCGRRRDFFWGSMILSRSAAIQE